MEKNKFNFSKLAALFTDYPALKIGEISYSYQQINDLIQRKLTDYSHSSKTVITLINDSPLNFIIDFLAIIESGNYPLVVDKSFKKKSFKFGLIPEDTLFLASTSGTTGPPKIYYRNWESWKMGFEVCDDLFHLSNSQALATTSPLTTSLGLHTLMCALYLGKTFLTITNPSQFRVEFYSKTNNQVSSFEQPDWENRLFKFKTLNLINSDFIVGRNAIVVGDISANNSTLSLSGKDTKVHIDMYDGKNITGDGFGFRQDIKDGVSVSPESSSYFGNVTLNNHSLLDIGNKFTGGIEAYDSSVSVTSQNAVFDRVGSFVNSSLTLEKGAKLTAQGGIFSTGAVDVKENASLILTGTPSAQKQEYYSPVISTTEGINLGDKASLSVKNMGYLSSDIHAGTTAATINLGDGDAETDSPLFSSLMKGYNAVLSGNITGEQSTVNMNNALWYSDGNSTIGTLKSTGGRVELGGGKDFATLRVKELNANNATFLMHTNNSQADQLNVTNKLLGSNNTVLVDFLNKPASEMNVTLITAPKGSDEKTFTAGTQQIGFSNVTPVISTEKTDDATKWMLTGYQTVSDAGASKTATDFMASG